MTNQVQEYILDPLAQIWDNFSASLPGSDHLHTVFPFSSLSAMEEADDNHIEQSSQARSNPVVMSEPGASGSDISHRQAENGAQTATALVTPPTESCGSFMALITTGVRMSFGFTSDDPDAYLQHLTEDQRNTVRIAEKCVLCGVPALIFVMDGLYTWHVINECKHNQNLGLIIQVLCGIHLAAVVALVCWLYRIVRAKEQVEMYKLLTKEDGCILVYAIIQMVLSFLFILMGGELHRGMMTYGDKQLKVYIVLTVLLSVDIISGFRRVTKPLIEAGCCSDDHQESTSLFLNGVKAMSIFTLLVVVYLDNGEDTAAVPMLPSFVILVTIVARHIIADFKIWKWKISTLCLFWFCLNWIAYSMIPRELCLIHEH